MAVVVATALIGGLVPAIVVGARERTAAQLPLHAAALHLHHRRARERDGHRALRGRRDRGRDRRRPLRPGSHARRATRAPRPMRSRSCRTACSTPATTCRACCRRPVELLGATWCGGVAAYGQGRRASTVVASGRRRPATPEAASMTTADRRPRPCSPCAEAGSPASDRSLLNAYAAYAKVMAERRQATLAEVERLQLAEADRTRTALLAAVSHDLRSPLAAVKASVGSLRSTAGHLLRRGRGGAPRDHRDGSPTDSPRSSPTCWT